MQVILTEEEYEKLKNRSVEQVDMETLAKALAYRFDQEKDSETKVGVLHPYWRHIEGKEVKSINDVLPFGLQHKVTTTKYKITIEFESENND